MKKKKIKLAWLLVRTLVLPFFIRNYSYYLYIHYMKKELTIAVNGKQYKISYKRSGDSFSVNISHEDLKPALGSNFTFSIKGGKPFFLITNAKMAQIASIVIPQILLNESSN